MSFLRLQLSEITALLKGLQMKPGQRTVRHIGHGRHQDRKSIGVVPPAPAFNNQTQQQEKPVGLLGGE